MLSLKGLQEIGIIAEAKGFRANIVSVNHAVFTFEYIPNYDLIITYSVVAGEVKVRTVAEGVSCDLKELKALNRALFLAIGLIYELGGVEVE
ncbi:MAG: hypothetical protein PHN69_07355 [Candidatus Pacebacteria bacterium]|nr:hypothetical protein [Candidatus Paceibacterota bacterium]